MTTFTGTSAIALSWTASGVCRGVFLRRVRDRCRVVRWWEGQKAGDRSLAEVLAEGVRALEPDAATVLVAGGDEPACGCLDLDMPALKQEELRNALAFEVRRSAPIPDDKLAWAYRVLPGRSGSRVRVRLYYLRQALWEQWLNHLGALTQGVDIVIPPAAALDPVLAGVPVRLSAAGGYVLTPTQNGGREVHAATPGGELPAPVFGDGPAPLAVPCLDPGELGALPPERQADFAAVLVLGMYGLSRSLAADRATGFELPYALKPRRHRSARLLAAVLALYTGVLGLYGLGRLYADHQRQYEAVHRERKAVEAQIADAGKRLNADEAKLIEQLRKETADLIEPRPPLGAALAEITRRVGPAGWCTSFRWSEGAISLQLRESREIEDLERTLEQSPLLGDVRQESKRVQAGVIDRKIEMNARYDLAGEQSAPPPARPRPEPAEADDVPDGEEDLELPAGPAVPALPGGIPRPPAVAPGGTPPAPPSQARPGAGGVPPPPPPPPSAPERQAAP